MITFRFFLPIYILPILLLTHLFGGGEKSSADIQNDIDSRNAELQILRNEIKQIEERLISKTKEAISSTEVLIDLENKISLTEKLIRSLHREGKYITAVIRDTEEQITKMETRLQKLKRQFNIFIFTAGRVSWKQSYYQMTGIVLFTG